MNAPAQKTARQAEKLHLPRRGVSYSCVMGNSRVMR